MKQKKIYKEFKTQKSILVDLIECIEYTSFSLNNSKSLKNSKLRIMKTVKFLKIGINSCFWLMIFTHLNFGNYIINQLALSLFTNNMQNALISLIANDCAKIIF